MRPFGHSRRKRENGRVFGAASAWAVRSVQLRATAALRSRAAGRCSGCCAGRRAASACWALRRCWLGRSRRSPTCTHLASFSTLGAGSKQSAVATNAGGGRSVPALHAACGNRVRCPRRDGALRGSRFLRPPGRLGRRPWRGPLGPPTRAAPGGSAAPPSRCNSLGCASSWTRARPWANCGKWRGRCRLKGTTPRTTSSRRT